MTQETVKPVLPPYVPYTTFVTFLAGLKENGVPSHIDRGVMSKMSGSGQAALTNSLKSMRLINSNAEPTELLNKLVCANEDEYRAALANVIKQTYPSLFDGSLDLATTASSKVQEKFQQAGASGSTVAKCMQFFLAAAKAADIKISNYVKPPKIAVSSRNVLKKAKKAALSAPNGGGANHPNEDDIDLVGEEADRVPEDMVKITVPLRDSADGYICFPKEMSDEQVRRAVKMADFILKNYYGLES